MKLCSTRWDVLDEAIAKAKTGKVVDGVVIECGVYKGESLKYIATRVGSEVHGFDSFDGLPEAWNGMPVGTFALSQEEKNGLHFPANVTLHRGMFRDSLPEYVKVNSGKKIALLHVDCDLYSSTVDVLHFLGPLLVSGSVVVFDELFRYDGWKEGEYKAFNEWITATGREYLYLAQAIDTEQAAVVLL